MGQDESFRFLPRNLVTFHCGSCAIIDDALKSLSHLTRLETLNIGFNKPITGMTFGSLPKHLKQLYCLGCHLSPIAPNYLNPKIQLIGTS